MKKLKIIAVIILMLATSNLTFGANTQENISSNKQQITNPPLIEGYFYRDNSDGKVYWLVFGLMHHVQDYNTFQSLFNHPDNYLFFVDNFQALIQRPIPSIGDIIGNPITPSHILGQSNGTVYLRRGGDEWSQIFRIPSPQVMDTYHLNWNSIINLSYDPQNHPISPNVGTFPNNFN